MTCIVCEQNFLARPVRYYFCSRVCWDAAMKNTAWKILSEQDFGLFTPVKLTTPTRYPRPS